MASKQSTTDDVTKRQLADWPRMDPRWASHPDWTAAQAAWLMYDLEPQSRFFRHLWPEAILNMEGRIQRHLAGAPLLFPVRGTSFLADPDRRFRPEALRAVVADYGLKPVFLYPGEHEPSPAGEGNDPDGPRAAPPSVEAPFPLRLPGRRDDWCELIQAAVKEFHAEHGVWPTETQTWERLRTHPPHGYAVSSDKDRGEDAIALGDRLLGRKAFASRWKRYTGPSAQ
jgi:hypothetical protein